MSTGLIISHGAATHRGLKRADNQDTYGKFPESGLDLTTAKGQLFIVADGMGGHAGGKEASETAVRLVQQIYFSSEEKDISIALRRAFEFANDQICQNASRRAEVQGMGTTCTAMVLQADRGYITHVGDSRAYRITRHKIEQLTQDHSKVAEMLRLGILNEEEAKRHPEKSHLYRALGIGPEVKPDTLPAFPLAPDERFLLCTDGIAKIETAEIKRIVLSRPPQNACDRLIEVANKHGGSDNSTVQVIWVKDAASAGARAMAAIRRLWSSE